MSHICTPLCTPPVHAMRVLTDAESPIERVKADIERGLQEEKYLGPKLLYIREVHEINMQEWINNETDVTWIYKHNTLKGKGMPPTQKMKKAYIAFVEITHGKFSSKNYIKGE